jgi:antitoxin (DNA-binding transcriptional repressor) of toxin-antitoxin stability system
MYEIELVEARAQLESVVQMALDGEEVVITQNHDAVLKLVPVPPRSKGRRRAGSAKGLVSMAEDFDELLEDFKE